MTVLDFQALIDAPELLVAEFFDLFEIEDTINFLDSRTFCLKTSQKLVCTESLNEIIYPIPLRFDEITNAQIERQLFQPEKKTLTRQRIYTLAMKNYPAGSS